MTFAIYGLLSDQAPNISNKSLADDLEKYFRNEPGFSLEFEVLPFSSEPSLALHWGDWLVRVSYEEGKKVEDDATEIKKRTDSAADFSKFRRQIRMVFGSDDEKIYTNEIIYLLDYLQQIDGVLVYDPQQNDFIE